MKATQTISETYYKNFFKECYFTHKLINIESTERVNVMTETRRKKKQRIYLNLN